MAPHTRPTAIAEAPTEFVHPTGEVEAHKHGHRDADITADDDSNDVEAHKHGGKDS